MNPISQVDQLRGLPTFGTWVERVEAALAEELAAYAERCKRDAGDGFRVDDGPDRRRTKAVKDSLWGMIDLSEAETIVADSPPMQRLRRIRQLGVTYLTYPTAGYSRFEHSLGAMHQSERMLRAITRRSAAQLQATVEESIELVRLATLLHDVGHLPLSHLSEHYYGPVECANAAYLDEATEVRAEIAQLLDSKAPNLGEVLSLAVVICPSMTRLLTEVAGYHPKTVASAALAIVAVPPSLKLAFVPNLVSNSIDADKLDYLFRDSAVTRIPLAVDLERLLYKLKVVAVPADQLPESLQRLGAAGEVGNLLASDIAGHALLFDLLASRSMLFDRIYFHHKTRAAERVALGVIRDLDLHPVDLLAHDDGIFTRYAQDTAGSADAIRRLESRDLPRRCFAFSWAPLLSQAEPVHNRRPRVEDSLTEPFDELIDDLAQLGKREELLEEIVRERDRLRELLADDGPVEPLWLEPTPPPYDISDPDLYVERPDGTVTLMSSYPQKASTFTRNPASTTYVFSGGGQQAVQLAHLAAALTFGRRYGLNFGRAAADEAKLDWQAIEDLKRRVEAADPSAFDNAGAARPASTTVRRQRGAARLAQLATRFSTYNVSSSRDHHEVVGRQSLVKFLDQFPENLVEPMTAVLEDIDFLFRDDLGRRLADAISANAPDSGVIAAPITDKPGKSAASLPRLFADSGPEVAPDVRSAITAVTSGSSTSICLFDDVTLSGKQAATALQVMFGVEPDLPAEADIATELSADEQRDLRQIPLNLQFVYADRDGLEHLTALGDQLQLRLQVNAVNQHAKRGLAAAGPRAEELEAFLRKVGEALQSSSHGPDSDRPWTPEVILDRVLGYGNRALLVVMYDNCPTATITALWKRGTFRGVPWHPLFPRSHDLPDEPTPGGEVVS